MPRFGYSHGGNGLNGRGRMGLHFQSWDYAQDGAYEHRVTPKRPGMLGNEKSGHSHVCKPIILDAEGRMITGVPRSCRPNATCNVLDYSDMQCHAEKPKAKGFLGDFSNYGNGSRRGGFPEGMFQRMSSVRWNSPTYGGDKYTKDWNEDVGWSKPSQNGWGVPLHYSRQSGWETGQAYADENGWQTAQGYVGAMDSREAAKRSLASNWGSGTPATSPPGKTGLKPGYPLP